MPSLDTTVGGVPLICCIYNASGPRTGSAEALEIIGRSEAGAVLAKSATLVAQDGNPMPRGVQAIDLGELTCPGSINSEGLPNKGIDYYIDKETVDLVVATGKPYMLSLSGLKLQDNIEMINRIEKVSAGIAAVELNLACPNIPGKPTVAYDFEQMEAVLKEITSLPLFAEKGLPLGVKLAPYFDFPHFQRAAEIINKFPIQFVTCINTLGNALIVDAENEMSVIAPKGGFGGLAGGYVKWTALANVRQLRKLLREDIDIVGVGGIASGKDAFEMILCGASAVQVGTKHWTEGAKCFARIASELKELMTQKGYHTIKDFQGKLKDYKKPPTPLTFGGPGKQKKPPADAAVTSQTVLMYQCIIGMLLAVIAVLFSTSQH